MKGQGMITQIIIFGVTMTMALFLIIVVSESDEIVSEQEVEAVVGAAAEDTVDESVLSSILYQDIDEFEEVENNYDASFYEVVQELYSGDKFEINGNQYTHETVEEDINNTLTSEIIVDGWHQGSVILPRGTDDASPHEAIFRIYNETGEDIILEKTEQREGTTSRWNENSRKIPVSDGEVEVRYWAGRG